MSKTKYKKVSVSDRLPEVTKEYNTNCGFVKFSCETKIFFSNGVLMHPVKYWLEEVPDMEDEMKEMLDRIQDLNILPEEIEDELSLLLKKLKS